MLEYIKPTENNILDCMLKDSLARNRILFSFCEEIMTMNEAVTIALDGGWGTGKSFFVKQAKMIFDALNPQVEIEENIRNSILNLIEGKLEPESITENVSYTVYYDAWDQDDSVDPLLSLLYAIAIETNSKTLLSMPPKIGEVAGKVIDSISTYEIFGILKSARSENPLDVIETQHKLKENINWYLNELHIERGNRLNIIIDELDRCSPAFAIKLLERIKHFVDHDNITFIFAVNIQGLEKTVRHFYGTNIEGTRYLDRFFDLRMMLPITEDSQIAQLDFGTIHTGIMVCQHMVKRLGMSLRESLRYAKLYRMACRYDIYETACTLWKRYLLPIALAFEITDMDRYQRFMTGNGKADLNILLETDNLQRFLTNDFVGSQENQIDPNPAETLQSIIEEFYMAIFNNDFSRNHTYTLSNRIEVSLSCKQFIFKTIGLFNPF
ncbi:MAG: hypothetical protein IJ121_04865 [Eubacterium sp.]|nr:hypothetical protein [Eubacterium sp.]